MFAKHYMRGQQTCSGQSQRVNILDFVSRMVSVITTQVFTTVVVKAAIGLCKQRNIAIFQ